MTAAPPEAPVIEGLRSLEVRWILPGPLDAAVAGWFARFPAEVTTREDAYLLDPELRGLSVKVRAGTALEVKVYSGSPGILEAPGRARGRIQSWQKWSFPFSPPGEDAGEPPGWTVIRKRRQVSRFRLASGRAEAAPGPGIEPGCAVELTEIRYARRPWWSLGFEATGAASLLRSALQAAARQVFARPLPGEVELGLSCCQSYAQWLVRRREPGETQASRW